MSEQQNQHPENQIASFPTPYNLNDFPAYKEELLNGADEPARAAVEQTFDQENPGALDVLTDPEYSQDLSAEEHEAEFHQLYPAFDKVIAIHERTTQEGEAAQLRARAVEARKEALGKPGSYLSHWGDQAARARDSEDPDARRAAATFAENGDKLGRLQSELLSNGADASVASEWYLRLGATSRGRGAEDMLVFAAQLPLEKPARSKYHYGTAENLLMKGSMLSEASLVNERFGDRNVETQRNYEDSAKQWFGDIIEAAGSIDSPVKRQAEVYVSDLAMREAHRLAADAKLRGGDPEMEQQAAKLAGSAVADMRDIVLRVARELDTSNDDQVRRGAVGELVERTILLLLREYASRGHLASEAPYQAFPRQDYPKDDLARRDLKRQAYDVVERRWLGGTDGKPLREIEIPIQAKNSKGGMSEKVYEPQIVVMTNFRDQVADVVKKIPSAHQSEGVRRSASAWLGEVSGSMVSKINTKIAERMNRDRVAAAK